MRRIRIFMAVCTAMLLLAACGQESAVSIPESSAVESSSVSEISAEEPSSAESEPEEIPSGETEEDIVRYATSAETDGVDYPELVCLLLPEGETVEMIREMEDGNYMLLVDTGEQRFMRLITPEGRLLSELTIPEQTVLTAVEGGYSLYCYADDTSIYYNEQLQEIAKEALPHYPYSTDYSEDGKYLQLIGTDGSCTNLAETGAESYQDLDYGLAGVYGRRAGKWESYSDGGRISGIIDRGTGEVYRFDEPGGIEVYCDAGEYLVCTSQGQEGGIYPNEPYVYQFYPETGELKKIALPYRSYPSYPWGEDGRYFAYYLDFANADAETAARMKTELLRFLPELEEADMESGVTYLIDTETLELHLFHLDGGPIDGQYQAVSRDGQWQYVVSDSNKVYKLPIVIE